MGKKEETMRTETYELVQLCRGCLLYVLTKDSKEESRDLSQDRLNLTSL